MLKWGLMAVSGRYANKTVERKAPKRCTFSPDDPKTSMALKLLGGNKNSIRSLFGEFLLLGKLLPSSVESLCIKLVLKHYCMFIFQAFYEDKI